MSNVKELKNKDAIKCAIRGYLVENISDLYLKVLTDIRDRPTDDLSDATKILIARKKLSDFICDIDTLDDDVVEAIGSFVFLEYCRGKYSKS